VLLAGRSHCLTRIGALAEDARSSPDANYNSLLLMALFERGEPMTLEEHGCETPWAEVQLARLADGSQGTE
jgi:hypothetical protein